MQAKTKMRKGYDMNQLVRLLGYLRPYKAYALAGGALILLNAPLMLIGPPLTKAAVDLFMVPDQTKPITGFTLFIKQSMDRLGFGGSAVNGVLFIALLFLLSHIVSIIIQYSQIMLMQTMGQYIMYDIREGIFAHLQKLSVQFYDRSPLGGLMTRLTTDVETLNEVFTTSLIAILSDFVIASYIVFYMFKVDWRLALVSFAIMPLLIATTIWFRSGTRTAFREIRLQVGNLNAFLQEHLGGMTIVQLFNREEQEMRKFVGINEKHRQANTRAVTYYAIFHPLIDLIGAIGIALVIWYGGGQVLSKAATIGTLIAFIQLTQAFYAPIADFSERYGTLQSSIASSERIFSLLDEPVTIQSPQNPVPAGRAAGRIEFRNVWFAYEGEDWILKDVSFIAEPGERVALVGHTGAGKSTIINLLLRFYDIQRGQILLDDVDIRQLDLEALRSNFSVVIQDVFLYSGDIMSNIRLGHTGITDEQVRAAAREVYADTFITALPEGYQTEVRERGAGLSAGQKQLISFARALAFDPSILLLDEATSSIDSETETLVRHAVEKLMKKRTSIVVAHRLSTIQSADKIIVIHEGEVHEIGTHRDLLNQKGLYSRLYQLQFQDDEADVTSLSSASE